MIAGWLYVAAGLMTFGWIASITAPESRRQWDCLDWAATIGICMVWPLAWAVFLLLGLLRDIDA